MFHGFKAGVGADRIDFTGHASIAALTVGNVTLDTSSALQSITDDKVYMIDMAAAMTGKDYGRELMKLRCIWWMAPRPMVLLRDF